MACHRRPLHLVLWGDKIPGCNSNMIHDFIFSWRVVHSYSDTSLFIYSRYVRVREWSRKTQEKVLRSFKFLGKFPISTRSFKTFHQSSSFEMHFTHKSKHSHVSMQGKSRCKARGFVEHPGHRLGHMPCAALCIPHSIHTMSVHQDGMVYHNTCVDRKRLIAWHKQVLKKTIDSSVCPGQEIR